MRSNLRLKLFGVFPAVIVLSVFALSVSAQNMFRKMNDFDGDGKADFAITRREGGYKVWYIWQSRDGFKAFLWGVSSDMNAPGDYDGDGKTDIAVFRPVNFQPLIHYFWIWNRGSNNFTQVGFENVVPAFAPMQQDYNGDGKTDPAVWIGSFSEPPPTNPTNVYAKYSPANTWDLQFQIPLYQVPIRLGDLTGDGRADNVNSLQNPLASNNGVVNISDIVTGATRFVRFGMQGDRFVPGDFDGDGIGDLAIFRQSNGEWWWIRSSDSAVQVANWGVNGDVPVPADYDGDGKTDLAIWRPGSGQSYFWVNGSQNGVTVMPWGLSTDTVVAP